MAAEGQTNSHAVVVELGLKGNKSKPWDPLGSPDWDDQEYTATALTRIKRSYTKPISPLLPVMFYVQFSSHVILSL